MDPIDEIKRLSKLLEEGAINREEFDLLKKKVITTEQPKKDVLIHEKNEPEEKTTSVQNIIEDVPAKAKKKKERKPGKVRAANFFVILSLLLLVASGLYFGAPEYSLITAIAGIVIALAIYFGLYKVLKSIFSRLAASLILCLFPLSVVALFYVLHINLFSRNTYIPDVKLVIQKEYDGSKLMYSFRKDTMDSTGELILTGMYKSFGEDGTLIAKGRIDNGIMVGEWIFNDYGDKIYLSFDSSADLEAVEQFEDSEWDYNDSFDSYAEDIQINNSKQAKNGRLEIRYYSYVMRDGIYGGIYDGDFSMDFDGKLYVKGAVNSGILDGMCKFYNPQGKVYKEVNYENGIPVSLEFYNENVEPERVEIENGSGMILSSVLFNGNYHGHTQFLDKYGEVLSEGEYIDGNLHGEWRYYGRFSGGYSSRTSYEIKSIDNYYNGHLHGLRTSYWAAQGRYSDGVGDVINLTKEYRYGKQEGTYTKYGGSATRRARGVWYTEEYRDGELIDGSKQYH